MTPSTERASLLSPIDVGGVTLRNRIVLAGHNGRFSPLGTVSRREYDYYVERARGGVGLIVTGIHALHPTSPNRGAPAAYHRDGVASDQKIAAAVHAEGAAIFAQICHTGSIFPSDMGNDPRHLWAPGAIRMPGSEEVPKAMDVEDIEDAIRAWGTGAAIIRESGFDGVELHFGHHYLMHQFLSPLWNRRTDDYGGSRENRLRFPLAALRAVREAVGTDWVVGIRLGMSEFDGGPFDRDEVDAIVDALDRDGAVDYFSLSSAGLVKGMEISPATLPDGHLLELAASVRRPGSGAAVMAVGGVREPALAERIVRDGTADLVAMVRAQIAEPELARKIREGREREIQRCIRCNQGCISRVWRNLPMSCTVNPSAGRERRFGARTFRRAASPRHWVVVGGGPAGLKAAATLGERGHRVTLLEREDELGGQLRLIVRTPGRASFASLVEDLAGAAERAGVEIRLATRADADGVLALEPDSVLVATGARPSRSVAVAARPLAEPRILTRDDAIVDGWQAIRGDIAGDRVVVLDDDGGAYAAGVAGALLAGGRSVHLVTRFAAVYPFTDTTLEQPLLYREQFSKGLTYTTNAWVDRIDAVAVTIVSTATAQELETRVYDTIVVAGPAIADADLFHELRRASDVPVVRIGDCLAPRKLDHAIHDGFLAGRELWATSERYVSDGELERWS